ncbi:MAG: ribonuclease E/G, partial [Myxococcota bacterium]
RKVWLKSGGYLIVDQSEALTAIDVNTGRYVGRRDLEETVLKTNLEAVQEVVQQLRFRNLGGLIIIDLIDMESAENREKVHRALREALREDKARTNILKISELGLVEMTRKRTRENLVQQLCEPCGYCDGRGYVLSAESVAFKLLREIRKDLPRFSGRQIAVSVNPQVGEMLEGPARLAMLALGEEHGREIEVRTKPGMHQEQFELEALDSGAPLKLAVPWLETRAERAAAEKAAAEAKAAEELRVAREKQEAEAAEAARRAEREQERERKRAEAQEAEAAEAASGTEETASEAEPAAADGDGAAPDPADGGAAPEGVAEPLAAPIAAAASPEAESKPAWDEDDEEPTPRPATEAVDAPAEDPILPRFDKLEES